MIQHEDGLETSLQCREREREREEGPIVQG